ncbi:serine--tRNA ligase [Candidatus Pacearchaeota archaeon RBG_19FT_COMBO_34_9]|nr:MAG: serine--tRNA ligase [Candidatus Pacearchaeota archaeon RBG_19FT_COMBO_34_9]OGJ17327.1 MAG: serine--tRNA ligase [Candidatus Pacearchaeota archaeon RBG_13_33_26]
MIDIKLIRENPEFVKKNCKNRGYDSKSVDEILAIDRKWRILKKQDDDLRAEKNKISKQINEAKKQKKDISQFLKEAKEIPEKLERNENEEKELKKNLDLLLSSIPNMQKEDVPVGGEEKNKVIHKKGKIPKFSFSVKSHVELLEKLNLLNMEEGVKVAGSGFYMLKGELAQFERALINFMLDFHIKDGFTEINPPQLVNSKTMFGTGQLPKFENDLYKTREGFYLIPTAEVVVTNLHADEVLNEKDLPKKYVSFTQCYRTEAGRHGAETPGIFRLHEFEKVEMVYVCRQEDSWKLHEEMTARAEKILQLLKLPYQRKLLATADAGFASAKTYDLEVWSPYLKKYLETSSCSNCTDFQARRMNTRYQSKNGMKFAHTLNGSGLATPRLLISLVENNQQKDGSIKIPAVLQKYMGGKKFIGKNEKEKNKHSKKKPRKK